MAATQVQSRLPRRWALASGGVLVGLAGACDLGPAAVLPAPDAATWTPEASLAPRDADPAGPPETADADAEGTSVEEPPSSSCARGQDDDLDGVPTPEERAAGLNPQRGDTDGDGCGDLAELLLGGCADPRRVIAFNRCFTGDVTEQVAYVAPARAGGDWSRLSLVIDESASDAIEGLAIVALSSAGGPASDGASFVSVPAGAKLTFALSLKPRDTCRRSIALKLVDEAGEQVDRGTFVVAYRECPIVI